MNKNYSTGIEQRIVSLDAIRGIALFGILIINIASFTIGGPPGFSKSPNPIDNVVTNLLLLLVESKFFTLFSLLFGISFSILFLNTKKKGKAFGLLFSRRLFGLFLFGVLHIILLWSGDILLLYSMVGIILLFFRNVEEKTLLKWSIGLLLVPTVLVLCGIIIIEVARHMPTYATTIKQGDISFVQLFKEGQMETINQLRTLSFSELAYLRVKEYIGVFPLLFSRIPTVLAMFLLGLYIGKKNILQQVEYYRPLLMKLSKWGIGIGLVTNILIILLFNIMKPITGVMILFLNQTLAGPILSVSFGALLLMVYQSKKGEKYLSYFAFSGRMALSNYLFQSIFFTIIFYSYGLGLSGVITTTQAVLIAISIYFFQIYCSRIWLTYFKFGPFEWIWRCITYWQMVRIK